MKSMTLHRLYELKQLAEKITCLTCYDATFARVMSHAEIEVLLVGDTLGMVVQGHGSTLPVKVNDLRYHIQNVARGNQGSWIIGDMPFLSYATLNDSFHTAETFISAGAHMVKMEGGEWLMDS